MYLYNFTLDKLEELFPSCPRFRLEQLHHWIYHHGVLSIDKMHTLPASMRKMLSGYSLERPTIVKAQKSSDGTQKWLLSTAENHEIETVHIPEARRGTLCISSQVGCTLTCTFCHTGTQRFVRNLHPHEIVGQVLFARDVFHEWPTPKTHKRHISHIVFMGMGEPLLNYDNVVQAIRILCNPKGIDISPKRITLSTSGIVPAIEKLGQETHVNLAISLHAPTDSLRSEIVPINKKYPLKELLAVCKHYPKKPITFEYVMLDGINDSEQCARDLIACLKGIACKVNLIPFNPWPNTLYTPSPFKAIQRFAHHIEGARIPVTIRKTRGQDILAACGQLKSATKKPHKFVAGTGGTKSV